jgi:tol-pal system protein YbgF
MRRLLALAPLLLVAGCASPSKSIDQEQVAQANFQADVAAIKSSQQQIRMRLESVEAALGAKGGGHTLEDFERRLTRLEETVSRMAATLGVDTGVRVPSPSQPGYGAASPGYPSYPAEPGSSTASPGFATAPGGPAYSAAEPVRADSPPAGPISMGADSTDPAEAIYNMGMEAYNQRDYTRANTLFTELGKSYPGSRQIPNALFWQAESNFQQGDYGRAALLCEDLIQKYPRHPMVPSAMLKQALCFRKLGKLQAAKILLQDAAKRYPNTPEARSAQMQLKEMP